MAIAQRGAATAMLQVLRQSLLSTSGNSRIFTPSHLILPSLTFPSICIPIPGLVSEIWDGILKAVPKKKTSHMKKRHRQLAGKALKDVNAVNNCSGCGKPKKAHTLCPYCVAEIKESWKQAAKQAAKSNTEGNTS